MTRPSAEKDAPVVLDLDDRYFDGQTLPDALSDYAHVHSATGLCVKNVHGSFCALPSGAAMPDAEKDRARLSARTIAIRHAGWFLMGLLIGLAVCR